MKFIVFCNTLCSTTPIHVGTGPKTSFLHAHILPYHPARSAGRKFWPKKTLIFRRHRRGGGWGWGLGRRGGPRGGPPPSPFDPPTFKKIPGVGKRNQLKVMRSFVIQWDSMYCKAAHYLTWMARRWCVSDCPCYCIAQARNTIIPWTTYVSSWHS